MSDLNIPVTRMPMPEGEITPLMGFDFDGEIYHVLAFDSGDDGGAIGVWKQGSDFCARLSLDALALFWKEAESSHPTVLPGGFPFTTGKA